MTRTMKESGIEWIGTIPSEWLVTKNKRLFNKKKALVGTEFEKYQLLSLTTKGIKTKDINNPSGKLPESFSTYQEVERQNIVLCLFDLDVSAVFSGKSNFNGMISPAYSIYETNEFILPEYAELFFKLVGFKRNYIMYSKSLRRTINQEIFKEIETIVPSLGEQKKIVDFLENKNQLINSIADETKQSILEMKKYKNTLITEITKNGINQNRTMKDSKVEYIGMIPNDWNILKLRYLGNLQNGISKSGEFFGQGSPFLSYGDVYKNIELPRSVKGLIQSTDAERENYSVQCGDVLFTRTSETIEEIGFASTCLETINDVVFAGFLIRFRPFGNDLYPGFSKYYFRSQIHRKFFVKEVNLVTRASLSQELLKRLPILLPPLEEQKKIAEYLDEKCSHIDKLINQKQRLLIELESYKKSIIYEYVTGKKEVL